jgi:hypothetical protein
MQPLTHHQIIGLVEPFVRRGRHVDLAASNRLERWIVFKPVVLPDAAAGRAGLRELLKLEHPYDGFFRLTRRLECDDAPAASLVAEGADVGALLQRIEAVAPQRQFSTSADAVTALSFRLDAPMRNAPGAGAALVLTDAVSRFAGYTLSLRLPRTRSMAAELELAAPEGSTVVLPEDLLAVIGWDWSPLRARKGTWTGKVRLRGKEPRRSASAEHKLQRTVRHLAATLQQPPGAFHARHAPARFGAALRRGIPSLAALGMIGGALMLPRTALEDFSPLRLMLFNLPTLLLALAFSMQELPRFEIPPWPRPLKATDWPTTPT